MGVPLWRAWHVCDLLDRADTGTSDRDMATAMALSTPTWEELRAYERGVDALPKGRLGA